MTARFGSAPRQTKRELRSLAARVERVEKAVTKRLMEAHGFSAAKARVWFLHMPRRERDELVRAAGFNPLTGERL